MRKFTIAILVLATILMVAGCQKQSTPVEMKVAYLSGPTALTMLQMAKDKPSIGEEVTVTYEQIAAPNVMMGKLTANELDMAVIATNQAAMLFNKGTEYQILAPSVWGALYMVGMEELTDINSLKGEEIALIGKGLTPDIMLRHILKENDIDPEKDVTLTYLSGPKELLQSVIASRYSFAVLPEPLATTASIKKEGLKTVLDFQEQWQALTEKSSYPQASLVVNKAFAEENPELVATFLEKYQASIEWANENPEDLGKYAEELEIGLPAAVVQKAVGSSNLKFTKANDVKDEIKAYFEALYNIIPESIGGKLPDDSIYYNVQE
ncbi:ABC transporter substrate-binding protein [Clostridium sp. 'deep sea']|uniref:ABC transporter substrate-binding protein n=1 Tax=Clostridium sp. 'deep sea' TaxID=2779445 RepID=UPI00189694BD|nr:MqnA/MqnD/SBP family protein [Clostridium sp. 'deep sea']QOR34008.1 ABC transporter substrate-binding protein [Clostridium sp. 'deep sea']